MATVKQKYLKDENGDIFTPIVHASSVYREDVNVAAIMNWSNKRAIGQWGQDQNKLQWAVFSFEGSGKTSEDISHGLTDITKIVAILGGAYNQGDSTSPFLTFGFYNGANYFYRCFATRNAIKFRCSENYIWYNRYVILYYK